jgi:N-ethylmaleimide reductase
LKKDINRLYTPFHLGPNRLANRFVMAPLTRNRAQHGSDAPQLINAKYYAQRAADAGLIISEASQISPTGKGYAWTPGIYSREQIKGWKLVTQAVHDQGGVIYCQLWHVGRISHPSLQPQGGAPVAPSAIAPVKQRTFIENNTFTAVGKPRALALEEILGIIEDYRQATRNAIEAGFDGVELHGANGYLIQQFLSDRTNHRHDQYGGSIENRLRFALEVTQAVIQEIGKDRTGIRISPVTPANDAMDSNPFAIYFPLVRKLNQLQISYIHVIEGATGGSREFYGFDFKALRQEFNGVWMVNNGYTLPMAVEAVTSGYADLVAFGKLYIANPNLAERFRLNIPLNEPDSKTYYGGGEKGYIDYPC